MHFYPIKCDDNIFSNRICISAFKNISNAKFLFIYRLNGFQYLRAPCDYRYVLCCCKMFCRFSFRGLTIYRSGMQISINPLYTPRRTNKQCLSEPVLLQLPCAFLAPAVTVGETEGAVDSASVQVFTSSFAYNFVRK